MKKRVLFTFLFFLFISVAHAQQYRPNGGCFTPRGELKILVVFVGFGDNDSLLYLENWPVEQDFPNGVMEHKVFYDNFAIFDDSLKIILYISHCILAIY
jgi:hypothetical protein